METNNTWRFADLFLYYLDAVLEEKTPRIYSLPSYIRAQAGYVFPLQQVQRQQWNQLVELWCLYYLPSCSIWSESLTAHTQNTLASRKGFLKTTTCYMLIGAPGKALSTLTGLICVIPLTLDARLMYRIMHLHYVFFGVRSDGSETWITISTKFLVRARLSGSERPILRLQHRKYSSNNTAFSTENMLFDWNLCLWRAHR